MTEELGTKQLYVSQIAKMSFARGNVGQRHPLTDEGQKLEFANSLALCTQPITKANTADCGDERRTLRLADGTTDVTFLKQRVVSQLFGGLGLATTKALIAADSPLVKDARSFTQAYMTVSEMLFRLGQEDAAHEDCGASKSVEASVANAIELASLAPSVGLLLPTYNSDSGWLEKNTRTKQARLEDGFYGDWNPQNHQDYVSGKFPQNFSYLEGDEFDPETHGHNGSGVYIVQQPGKGLAKNEFIEATGKQSFAVTAPKMIELAELLDPTKEGRMRILLGFVDDTFHVGAGIVTKDMPVFSA